MNAPHHQRMRELLDLLCEGTIDTIQFAELDTLACRHQDARKMLAEYLELDGHLRWEFGAGLDSDVSARVPQPSSTAIDKSVLGIDQFPVLSRRGPARFRTFGWHTLLIAAAFYGLFATLSWNLRSRSLPQRTDGSSNAIANIRNSIGADWSDSNETPSQPPSAITPGRPLKIEAGLVELQLKKGARLVIEGPAEWTIDGENRATLKRGRIRARVPQQAIGFTLHTPTARIVDLGTEFAVEVNSTGDSQVKVIEGQIEVALDPPLRGASQVMRLGKQQAVSVDARRGLIQPLIADATAGKKAPDKPAGALTVSSAVGPSNQFPCSATDLIEAGSVTLLRQFSSRSTALSDSNPTGAGLNNGTIYMGQESTICLDKASFCPEDNTSITFELNTDHSPFGYDLLWIMSVSGGGQGRRSQTWRVEYMRVASDDWIVLADKDQINFHDDNIRGEMRVKLERPQREMLATNVAKIRFTFFRTLESSFDHSIYREIDVYGVKSRVQKSNSGQPAGHRGSQL